MPDAPQFGLNQLLLEEKRRIKGPTVFPRMKQTAECTMYVLAGTQMHAHTCTHVRTQARAHTRTHTVFPLGTLVRSSPRQM